MITAEDVISMLDQSNDGYYCDFVLLDQGYLYYFDSRINIFRNNLGQWAVAVERLGFNPREGRISIQIYYYGNCLANLESYNGRVSNYYWVYPGDDSSFEQTTNVGFLLPGAQYWTIRDVKVPIAFTRDELVKEGIGLVHDDAVTVDEVMKMLLPKYRELFRATNDELYKSVPRSLDKILVIDE